MSAAALGRRNSPEQNAKIAVTKVLRGRNREENEAFREFCGALALAIEFAAPGKGHEKG